MVVEVFDFFVDGVEWVVFVEFYCDGDGGGWGVDKGVVVFVDVFWYVVFVEVEFVDDLVFDVGVGVGCDDFLGMLV